MRDYELMIVLHPDLEADLEAAMKKVRAIITDNGGSVTKEDNWGKKRLAYSINKQDFGIYIDMDVALPAEAPAKISSVLNITEEVMRYLLVKQDEKVRAARAEAAAKAEQSSEE